MIWYFTGKPRSGKTYLAVYRINDFVSSHRYQTIYTNIGGFKFDKFSTVKKLDFEFFFDEYARTLYELFKKYKKQYDDYDEKIIEKVKEDGYYQCAFFVDECQTYLSSNRVHLLWLFSYQGHLGFDFYFITQALGLVHSKYKLTIENVTNSISSSFRLSNKYLTYQIYATTSMRASDKVSTFRLPVNQNIFKMYKSGDKIKQKSLLLPKLLLIITILIILIFYFQYNMSSSFTSEVPSQIPISVKGTSNNSYASSSHMNKEQLNYDEYYIMKVKCIYGECSSKKFINLPYPIFKIYRDTSYKIIGFQKYLYSVSIYIKTTDTKMNIFRDFLPMDKQSKKGIIPHVFDE